MVVAEAAVAVEEADMSASSNLVEAVPYRPKGLLLQWHLTNRCNLRCSHCYQETYGGGEMPYAELLSVLGQYEALLSEWRAAAGAHTRVRGHLTLTGGEPFVRQDFGQFLRHVASRATLYSFAILTNGSYIDTAQARELRRLRSRFVQVSMEGGRETHDAIRGAGDFDRTVAAIRRLVRFRVPTMISFTAHKRNFREFPEVARIGVDLGVSKVWSDRLIPSLAHGRLSDADLLTPEETQEYVSVMEEAKRAAGRRWWRRRTEVSMHRALQFLTGGDDVYHCTAGDTLITIMPNGEVYPCRRMPISVGNVRQTPLREIYYANPVLRQLRDRDRVSDGCEGCSHTRRCRGGLKCLSYAVTGSPFRRDPGCWLPDAKPRTGGDVSTCFDEAQV